MFIIYFQLMLKERHELTASTTHCTLQHRCNINLIYNSASLMTIPKYACNFSLWITSTNLNWNEIEKNYTSTYCVEMLWYLFSYIFTAELNRIQRTTINFNNNYCSNFYIINGCIYKWSIIIWLFRLNTKICIAIQIIHRSS